MLKSLTVFWQASRVSLNAKYTATHHRNVEWYYMYTLKCPIEDLSSNDFELCLCFSSNEEI